MERGEGSRSREVQTGGRERLENGGTEKWKRRKLSARGSEQQLAGDTPEMHLNRTMYFY
jgi:hypothetical protein